MTTTSPSALSDRELLHETARAAGRERQTTAELLALLAEVESRRLYLGEGFSSLFTYCTQALHLSESEAYSRITAARAARRFPTLLARLSDGSMNLTTVTILVAHLTEENHEAVLNAARHKTKREVEHLIACLHPQPDIASSVRRLPSAPPERPPTMASAVLPDAVLSRAVLPDAALSGALLSPPVALRVAQVPTAAAKAAKAIVAPLSADRYLMRITISGDTRGKLDRARDLLRHTIPNADPAAIVDRALTVLLEHLEKQKTAAARRPRPDAMARSHSRHVPAAVRRAVWKRDMGRCAFIGSAGRCQETGFLEFHHVEPYSAGGPTTVDNLQLRCRAHNAYEARDLWPDRVGGRRPDDGSGLSQSQ